MKKIFALLFAAVLLVTALGGCSLPGADRWSGTEEGAGDGETGGQGETQGTVTSQSNLEMYHELAELIEDPDSKTSLPDSFTFVAVIVSEVFEAEVEGEDSTFAEAMICRSDEYFFLDLTDVKDQAASLAEGDYVRVTGSNNGWLYWSEDNQQIEKLDILVSAIELYVIPDVEADHSMTVRVTDYTMDGEFEFIGAHYTNDQTFTNWRLIVLYFNFTNHLDSDSAPYWTRFYAYHGDVPVVIGNITHKPNEIDPSAVLGYSVNGGTTYAGRTTYYYITLKAEGETDDPLYLCLYDDEFVLYWEISLDIWDSLEEMTMMLGAEAPEEAA